MTTEPTDEQDPVFNDARDEVLRVARIAKIDCEFPRIRTGGKVSPLLLLHMPNGRNKRRIVITELRASQLSGAGFESWTLLGDYIAYFNKSLGIVEALLRPVDQRAGTPSLIELPGVLFDDETTPADPPHEIYDDEGNAKRDQFTDDWRLPVELKHNQSLKVQLQRANTEIRGIADTYQFRQSGGATLYITGLKTDRHDDALEILERYASALFFELDLRFEVGLGIARRRPRAPLTVSAELNRSSSLLPLANLYASQPVSLYFYARSATGMPLLQFLAYYQALEFFFPSFSNSEILRKLRFKLRDPRFDAEDDANLQDLISMASGAKRGGFSEKEQLRMTLVACIDSQELRAHLKASRDRLAFFEEAKQKISGTKKLSLSDGDQLIQQVADRVYAIRCRIVHSKENGDRDNPEALLPAGEEADNLHHDISLIQFLAQKVMICGSRGRLV